jgi:hypothetical protein
MRDIALLPPSRELPRDVEIPPLPGVGITWYDRGGRYWALRARMTFMWALSLVLIGLIDVGFFSAAHHSSPAAFAVLLVIEVAVTAAVVADEIVHIVRRWNVPQLPSGTRMIFQFGYGHAGAVLRGFEQLAGMLAIAAAAIVFAIFPALIVAIFLANIMPEPLPERQARLWMAMRLRERGIPPAG